MRKSLKFRFRLVVGIIDSIQMKDLLAAGEAFISEEAFSEFYMRPK
ncbi:hypothetical protein ACOY2X_03740 [Enterococcus faecium]